MGADVGGADSKAHSSKANTVTSRGQSQLHQTRDGVTAGEEQDLKRSWRLVRASWLVVSLFRAQPRRCGAESCERLSGRRRVRRSLRKIGRNWERQRVKAKAD